MTDRDAPLIEAEQKDHPVDKLLGLIRKRQKLEATCLSSKGFSEEAYNALTSDVGAKIGRLDEQIAITVATSQAGLIAQIEHLRELHGGTFSDDDTEHSTGCFDRTVYAVIAGLAAVIRKGGAV